MGNLLQKLKFQKKQVETHRTPGNGCGTSQICFRVFLTKNKKIRIKKFGQEMGVASQKLVFGLKIKTL